MKTYYRTLIVLILFLLKTQLIYPQWVQTNGPYGGLINCLAVSGTNIFAGTYFGVYLSTNNGTSWTAVNNGLTNYQVISLAVNGNNIFAGTAGYNGGLDGYVFFSSNNGTDWVPVLGGIPQVSVTALAVSGNNIYAGTDYYGVYLS